MTKLVESYLARRPLARSTTFITSFYFLLDFFTKFGISVFIFRRHVELWYDEEGLFSLDGIMDYALRKER